MKKKFFIYSKYLINKLIFTFTYIRSKDLRHKLFGENIANKLINQSGRSCQKVEEEETVKHILCVRLYTGEESQLSVEGS